MVTVSSIFCCFLLMVSSNAVEVLSTDDKSKEFKIGFLAPWSRSFEDFSGLTSASAVTMAIEKINLDPTLNDKMKFSIVTYDSGCSSKISVGNAIKLFVDEKIDGFIGPPCSAACRPVAELASFWNKPIISWVATDPDFNDKLTYTTLGRSFGPISKMGVFMLEVLKQYNWRRLVVISSNYYLWMDAGKAIRKVILDSNLTIAYSSEFDRFPPESYIRAVLLKTKDEGRIIVLIVPKEDRRRFMMMAHELEMTNGEYVFYTMEIMPEENVLNPEDVWAANDGKDSIAKQAFESVFHVTLAAKSNYEINEFRKEVARRMRLPPWDQYISKNVNMQSFAYGDKYAAFLYDAVMIYAVALNETITKGLDARSGVVVAKQMRKKVFKGMTGSVMLDENGDREPDYWITDMAPNGSFVTIAEIINLPNGTQDFRKNVLSPRWPGGKVGHQHAPPDSPPCGFRNELCPSGQVAAWIIALAIGLGLLALGASIGLGIYLFRRSQFENELLIQSWRIRWEEIESLKGGKTSGGGSTPSMGSVTRSLGSKEFSETKIGTSLTVDPSKSSQTRSMPSIGTGGGQIFSDIALHKGIVVALKHVKKEHMQITRQVLMEFNEIKDIAHENLNVFVGACVDPPNICIVWHYCSKGSLNDVLENEAYKLDSTFKLSFMIDLAKGMHYLHCTKLVSHGNLKSSNCLIDARWTLKITDYGLPSFLVGQDFQESESDSFKRKLWTAPEILRENFPQSRGHQKGDVYSFAIIMYEIMMRSEPYNFDNITPRDVVNRIRNGESIPYRPVLPETNELGKPMIDLIKSCWDENFDSRPTFQHIRVVLRKISGGEISILDAVMAMMEKYAQNMEESVDERAQQLLEEKRKTDRLLYRLLPATVAEQLKAGKFVQPENYDEATIYFSDIVGFNILATDSSPMQIVDFLNDLYTCFDDIIARHDVYKVETIGDAYMVVSGVPTRNGHRHVTEIANVSLDLLSAITRFKIRHRPHQQLQLRVGLHTGPVVAGVVGNIMPRYCLFGDAVNTAARMESSGRALRIHISKVTYISLNEFGGYEMTLRGEMHVKGKGIVTTYWLHGKKGYTKSLPAFDRNEVMKEDAHEDRQETVPRHALMQTYVDDPAPVIEATTATMPPVE